MIYLDNAATTSLSEPVLDAMMPFFTDEFANPSSSSFFSERPQKAIKEARQHVATTLNCFPDEVWFTSGGTESNNWALRRGVQLNKDRKHVVVSAIEHKSVLNTVEFLGSVGYDVSYIGVGSDGVVDLDELRCSMRDDTALVSVMTVNNETGVIQPIKKIARLAHQRGALFHTDAVQAAGKIPVRSYDNDVDMVSVSAHKFHGPKGVGALFVRRELRLTPLVYGGAQATLRRGGTPNVPGIVGMGRAAQLINELDVAEKNKKMYWLTELIWDKVSSILTGVRRNGNTDKRVGCVVNISFDDVDSEALVIELSAQGVVVAGRSACSSHDTTPSHVLTAMGLTGAQAMSAIRFSVGDDVGVDDINSAVNKVCHVVTEFRRLSGSLKKEM